MNAKGTLYLLPCLLGNDDPSLIASSQINEMNMIRHYIAENEKSARHFIKLVCPDVKQSELSVFQLNKHKPEEDIRTMLQPCLDGHNIGLLSEAGMPCIADPGYLVVALAHQLGIRVIPFGGLNSMMMTLMASGFNGQQFAFHGYLPIDKPVRQRKIKEMEMQAGKGVAQIFMETPYRNEALFSELVQTLRPQTRLCIGALISHPEAMIRTQTMQSWKNQVPDLKKIPAVFILGA